LICKRVLLGFLGQRQKQNLSTRHVGCVLFQAASDLFERKPSPNLGLQITRKPGQTLFGTLTKQNANYRFAKYARLAGLPKHKRHTHCLRHSRAMHTIKTAGIENVRQLCGHASIASTGYYLKVSDSSAWAALGTGAGL
jgi:integrase